MFWVYASFTIVLAFQQANQPVLTTCITQGEPMNNMGHTIKINAIEHMFSMIPLCAVSFEHEYSGRVFTSLKANICVPLKQVFWLP